MKFPTLLFVAVAGLWSAIGFLAPKSVPQMAKPATHGSSAAQVTFNRDIAPIVYHSCATCHRPGEAAPFPLLSYKDVKSHARQIAAITQSRIMPPWLPEPGPFQFADEMRLSNEQIALIAKWVEQGSLEGDPVNLTPKPEFVEGWQLGKPDLIVTAEKPYQLPATGNDQYWNFIFRTPIKETRWLRALEIRPGDKRLVHHANVLVDRMQSARLQESSPGAGFAGMEIKIESEAFDPDSHFLFWKPGTVPYSEPEGMALRLDPETDLVLNIHLQPSGKPEWIQPTLGLYFTDHPATRLPMLLQLENDRKLDIPAGAKNFIVEDEFTLPEDVKLLAIYPHAHYVGKDLAAYAKFPDGARKSLIHIPNWNLNWQAVYRYAEPVQLPEGTVVSMRYVYDNSEDNALNPNDPPQRIVGGNSSKDEMAHLWLQVLPESDRNSADDPRRVLQEAMAKHNVEKNPEDFEAHYNLAAMLQIRGELGEALKHYEEALRLRPEDAAVNNAFGAANLAAGRLDIAVRYLEAALRVRPEYFDAHYNLGMALAMSGNFARAAEEFRAALGLNPQDANAEANLGGALAELGNLSEARTHLERALALDPNHTLARENLAEVRRQLDAKPH
ncbi:MAG TPA: tetratricopeptide repeat protein [Terriglobales bacterium]|nr:tetratricopeptide repeat protein [Terriglobales bacterium]